MSSNTPLVTIAITSYNYCAHIADAVRSALNQTYRNIEVLVLDNASTDDSVAIVQTFETDDRLRLIVHAENIGIQGNHNVAINVAKGEFIVFLSADDILLPTLLADMFDFRRHYPTCDIVYSTIVYIDRDGKLLNYFDHPAFDGAQSYYWRNEFANQLTRDAFMYLPTVLFPKSIFEKHGTFDEMFMVAIDYELFIRLAASGIKFGFIAKPGVLVRLHGENRSGVKNYLGSGCQLREYTAFLERYTHSRYHESLAGYGSKLQEQLGNKVRALQSTFPETYHAQQDELDVLVERARASIATVPEISAAVLRGDALISVIVPFHGRIGALHRALQSLAAQSYQRWEAIIVANGAIDPSPILQALCLGDRARVTYMRSAVGPAQARNVGLMGAQGEIVAYLDEDNLFEPKYFEALAAAFTHAGVNVTVAQFSLAIVDGNGDHLLRYSSDQIVKKSKVSRIANALPLNAIAHRRSLLARSGDFNASFLVLEDWEFLLRLERCGGFLELDEPASVLCLDVTRTGHQLFSRQNSVQWSEYASRLQDIYNAYPPGDAGQEAARRQYAQSLQNVIQSGVRSTSAADVMQFEVDLCGIELVKALT